MFRRIKEFFSKRKKLKTFEYGDIIWCNVKKYGKKFNFPQGHQVRPFLFVEYKRGKIYGYTLTHNDKLESLSYVMQFEPFQRVVLSCLFELKAKLYVDYYTKMSEDDLRRISKIIYNMHTDEEVRNSILNHIRIDRNDLVLYNNVKHLVYANDQNVYTLYKITNDTNDILVKNDKDEYYISNEPIIIKNQDIQYIDTFKNDVASYFYSSRLDRKKSTTKKNEVCLIKRGDVFRATSGTLVALSVDGNDITATKLYNPDYKIRKIKYRNQPVSSTVSEYELEKLESEIEKINSTFSV